jgi:hypothetical protein
MSKTHTSKRASKGPLKPDDLINLVVKPLSGRIDQVWQHLFEKLQGIEAALDIIARQTARSLREDGKE